MRTLSSNASTLPNTLLAGLPQAAGGTAGAAPGFYRLCAVPAGAAAWGTPPGVTPAMAALHGEGLIRTGRDSFRLVDRDALQAFGPGRAACVRDGGPLRAHAA